MQTFTIDNENDITAHGTPENAAAAMTTPFDSIAGKKELAELAKARPADRVVAISNSLPGEGRTEGQGWRTAAKGAPAKTESSKKAVS